MQWTKPPPAKGCTQSYHLESDGAIRYTIAKTFHDGKPTYWLWRGKEQLSGHDTAAEAMAAAEVL